MTNSKTVWLIDDDQLCNFLTSRILQSTGVYSEIKTFTNGEVAIAELERNLLNEANFPDLIFLDLNMPVVDGWEFLDVYRKFPKEVKESCTLYILSSSIDKGDINKSKMYEDVQGFLSKPLDDTHLELISS